MTNKNTYSIMEIQNQDLELAVTSVYKNPPRLSSRDPALKLQIPRGS